MCMSSCVVCVSFSALLFYFPNDITFHLTLTDLELRGSTRTLRGAVEGAVVFKRKQERHGKKSIVLDNHGIRQDILFQDEDESKGSP